MSFLYPAFSLGAARDRAADRAAPAAARRRAGGAVHAPCACCSRSPVDRSRRRRLRDLLLLAARVAALLLLAAAFARPYLAGAAGGSTRSRIVAVDRSFSMGAPGRFAHALDLAREPSTRRRGERVALVAFDDRADVLRRPGPRPSARRARGRQPGFAGDALRRAVHKAAEIAARCRPAGRRDTDLQRAGWEESSAPSCRQRSRSKSGTPGRRRRSFRHRVAWSPATGRRLDPQLRPRRAPDGFASNRMRRTAGECGLHRPARRHHGRGHPVPGIQSRIHLRRCGRRTGLQQTTRGTWCSIPRCTVTSCWLRRGRGIPAFTSPVCSGRHAIAGMMSSVLTYRSSRPRASPREQDSRRVDLAKCSTIVVLSTRGLERRVWESLGTFVKSGGGLVVAAGPEVDPAVLSSIFNWRPALDAAAGGPGQDVALSPTDVRHPIFRPFGIFDGQPRPGSLRAGVASEERRLGGIGAVYRWHPGIARTA